MHNRATVILEYGTLDDPQFVVQDKTGLIQPAEWVTDTVHHKGKVFVYQGPDTYPHWVRRPSVWARFKAWWWRQCDDERAQVLG